MPRLHAEKTSWSICKLLASSTFRRKQSVCAFPFHHHSSRSIKTTTTMSPKNPSNLPGNSPAILVRPVMLLGVLFALMLSLGASTAHAQSSAYRVQDGIGIVITEDICRVGTYHVSGLPKDWKAVVVTSGGQGVVFERKCDGSPVVEIDLAGFPADAYVVTVFLAEGTFTGVIDKGD
jgi:hypothetical protein